MCVPNGMEVVAPWPADINGPTVCAWHAASAWPPQQQCRTPPCTLLHSPHCRCLCLLHPCAPEARLPFWPAWHPSWPICRGVRPRPMELLSSHPCACAHECVCVCLCVYVCACVRACKYESRHTITRTPPNTAASAALRWYAAADSTGCSCSCTFCCDATLLGASDPARIPAAPTA